MKIVIWILFGLFAVILVMHLGCSITYLVTGGKFFKRFYHDVLGWHIPDDSADQGFDGCSFHAKCKHCGKDIMQDSQGNWF